ncbi:MAG: YlxR family protein [Eggerthellaceae bacterium]|nr:YlxR family protein [Eggerthellaceae bacterium]
MVEVREKRVRTCVGCGEQSQKTTLMRIVRASDGSVGFDATGRAPGRGAYVCSSACLEQALRTRKLQRALKCGIGKEEAEGIAAQIAAVQADRMQ